MIENFTVQVIAAERLSQGEKTEIIELCSFAYEENFDDLFAQLPHSMHVLGRCQGKIVSHAAWVTRWLEPGGQKVLRTAYVEAVATRPAYQRRGLGSELMQKLQMEIAQYELGALSPSEAEFYQRLGWEMWSGPLSIRTPEGLMATPGEEVMIYRLERTPELNLKGPLSAEWRRGELW